MPTTRKPFVAHVHDFQFARDVLGGALYVCTGDNCDEQHVRPIACDESPTRDHQFEYSHERGGQEIWECHFCPRRAFNADEIGLPLYDGGAEVAS
jgi:hypothetical protein